MSKLAIFLCAALIASAVDASDMTDALVAVEAKLEALIEATVKVTQEKFDDIKSKAADNIAQLEVDAKAVNETVSQRIKSSLDKAQAIIDKLTSQEKSVDCTECNKLVSELRKIGDTVVDNVSACVDDKIKAGKGYVQNINSLSEKVLANLTTIRDNARHCSDDVHDFKAAASAIACTNAAALKTAWVEAKAVPSLVIEMTKIRYLIVTLRPSLAYCRVSNEIVAFYHEFSTISEKAKLCIDQIKQEIRPSTEKALFSEATPNSKEAQSEKVTEEVVVEA